MSFFSRRAAWRDRVLHTQDSLPYIAWLRDRGSLTERIREQGAFSVRLLRQELALPTRDEALLLGIRAGVRVRVREVALLCKGKPVVFAHTVLPCHPRGPLTRWLARIGTRSLGSLLFADPGFSRGEINCRCLDGRHPLFRPAVDALGVSARCLWARRSLFRFGRQSVLVTEVYSSALCHAGAR